MPDPTLTRYSLGPAPVIYINGEVDILDAEMEVYRCEEADRLIQALREELKIQDDANEILQRHLEEAEAHVRSLQRENLGRAMTVNELRSALEAAQQELTASRTSSGVPE